MQILSSIQDLPPTWPRTVAAIGNFDGVHLAHQEIIRRVRERASVLNARAIAVTFDPHPVALLHPERTPKLITPMPHRLRLLAQTGLDATVVISFTREFSLQSAQTFAGSILRATLRVVEVHEGDTFRFGHDAAAGIDDLKRLGEELGFGVVSHGSLQVQGITVSSSEVRRRIAGGEMDMASALLGRSFSILSTPVRGRGVGTRLATPTINLARYNELLPPNGVYVTRVRIGEGADAPLCNAVSNLGIRPTFEDAGFAIESHLLAGPPPVEMTEQTQLELCFLKRLREERRFPSADLLKAQILNDVHQAQQYFRGATTTEFPFD